MFNRIHHTAIICSDYKRSKQFYTEKLGLQIIRETYQSERGTYKLDLSLNGEYVIELFGFSDAPERPNYPEACGLRHLAFEVECFERTIDELLAKGIELEKARTDPTTGKRFTFFTDPDGLPIEIYEK
ncbi:SMU1112c/YaeR family gloxylase I-like metalloprotein [Virgibacillus senegalensis]|uniref:SMU1112c/YaeR family gloxylase I-like metalloprotein n=1 Tax=Virgibacillus senegalensis TaxID=1499679 RepID=UPI00069F6FB2|nr:VOC family protein [Virgibacillus senegalensis]